jgi:hypothetical protein
MSDIPSVILEIVENHPGIGPGEVADILGQNKSYIRRVMKKMTSIRAEINGNGYAFFPIAGRPNKTTGSSREACDRGLATPNNLMSTLNKLAGQARQMLDRPGPPMAAMTAPDPIRRPDEIRASKATPGNPWGLQPRPGGSG